MRELLAKLGEYWPLAGEQAGSWPFVEGFWAGLACGLVLLLILVLALVILRGRGRCRGVTLEGEAGSLVISLNALREFVTRILCEFGEASLHSVAMRESRGVLVLLLELEVLPELPVVQLVERVRQRIIRQAAEQLGIDKTVRVDVTIRGLSAKERTIARQSRKAGLAAPKETPLPIDEDDS